MKRILQALDGAATKPVAGVNDMKRFLQVVSSSPVDTQKSETLVEGANPHKVSLPVQMAMQHYQQQDPIAPVGKSPIRTGIRKFFREVETEIAEETAKQEDEKRQIMRQYSQQIAERVLMKEGKVKDYVIQKGERDDMTPQQFNGQYGKTKDMWDNEHGKMFTDKIAPKKKKAAPKKSARALDYCPACGRADNRCICETVAETRIIHADDKVDVYFNPQHAKTRQAVAKGVPNHKVDAILNTLAAKYNVSTKAFEWHPSKVAESKPGLMNENQNVTDKIAELTKALEQLNPFLETVDQLADNQHRDLGELEAQLGVLSFQIQEAAIDQYYTRDVSHAINEAVEQLRVANGKVYNILTELQETIRYASNELDDLNSEHDPDVMSPDLDESKMSDKITKRNPVAHAAQSVAKGAGAHKNKKREQEQPRKEKHKKSPVDEQISSMMEDPCWKDYKQIGMKNKGGKKVPNCVPKGK